MCLSTSFSNHLVMMCVSAIGRYSLKQVTVDFFGTGMILVVWRQIVTMAMLRDVLKMDIRTSASWSAHSLSTRLSMLSRPAGFHGLTLHKVFLTSA